MLFQGQEFAASAPFLFFADHRPELAELVRQGRAEFLGQFVSIATPEASSRLSDPSEPATFQCCKLDWTERSRGLHVQAVALVRDALRLRREDACLRTVCCSTAGRLAPGQRVDGAVLGEEAFFLRYFADSRDLDRLLVVNLGKRVHAAPLAEPLVAPPAGMLWRPLWSSEHPDYGGNGTPSVDSDEGGWWLPPECLIVLEPVARDGAAPAPGHPTTEKHARALWKSRNEKTAR
jgi:maltooligosyltrehalose trehalohydrolase